MAAGIPQPSSVTTPLAVAGSLHSSLVTLPDRTAEADLAVVDSNVESAFRIRANPRLVCDRCTITAIVGQRQHVAAATFSTVRELHARLAHCAPPCLSTPTYRHAPAQRR